MPEKTDCKHSWWDPTQGRTTVGDMIVCNHCGAMVNMYQIPPEPEEKAPIEKLVKEVKEKIDEEFKPSEGDPKDKFDNTTFFEGKEAPKEEDKE